MAKVKWTEEQLQVIDTQGRNLLVSAAAGSGKTAVLVERIIRMVTDPSHPVDIDRLLVMTFTSAAASEMRERIGDALEQRLEEHPGDRNLERQTTLIHHAKITTIDSFCLKLLREHFHELDIDPGFRIGDEGELMLLQTDVMKELLEDYYGRNDERFFRFVDSYASGKTDYGLEDYILRVYRFSQSNPWPEQWMEECRNELLVDNEEDLDRTAWMQYLIEDVRRQAKDYEQVLSEAILIAEMPDGPEPYLPMLEQDRAIMELLSLVTTYRGLEVILKDYTFGRLSPVRSKSVDPAKKEHVTAIRTRVKDGFKNMQKLYLPPESADMMADIEATREPVLMLLELAEEFGLRYRRAKEQKNLVDFNDLEHFALEILTGGSEDHRPGPVADELAKYYEEILVDEYQDSNEVQETLIKAISRERFGTPNVFMVGDVKQSIYKFRLAKPEIFLEKYETYKPDDPKYRKIELHKNFRSRSQVLNSINDVFYGIMTKELGNIRYTEETALYAGADYPEPQEEKDVRTELLLLNTAELQSIMDEDAADYSAKEAEARLIAAKIRELTDPETGMKIWNRKTESYEPLKKKDIVILLRSMSGWAEEFLSVLSSEGIPAFAESRTGYFSAVEVETVLNMLAVVDNPMQDIPLVGVLRSPIGGLDDRELAMIMALFKKHADRGQDVGFYGALRLFLELGDPETELYGKAERFWTLLEGLRQEAAYLPVHRLIYRIFEQTGYYDYASSMPAGSIRQANLNMLVEKAAAYEKTSYQSLFDFIRYIDKLKKYDTDFGEAARIGENEDTVRIMSIHKSKGLEFPVVFLAGAGKAFNKQDSYRKILIDEKLGIATDFFDPNLKIKSATVKKNVLSRRSTMESLGEELRVLYVAMTRAKEKLIITAGSKSMESKLEKYFDMPISALLTDGLPFAYLSTANSYLDWILMAIQRNQNIMDLSVIPIRDLVAEEVRNMEEKAGTFAMLKMLRENGSSEGMEDLEELLNYQYPHEADIALHAKMSVSELKHQGQFADDEESAFLPTIPYFMKDEFTQDAAAEEDDAGAGDADGENRTDAAHVEVPRGAKTLNGGTFRGTAYHRVLELIDFKAIHERKDVFRELNRIRENGWMDEASLNLIWGEKIWNFFRSNLAQRMQTADQDGKLHKESQFVMGVPARLMDEADSDEPVIIQGIIDVWFEEDGELVLVDYKTDRVAEGEEQVLLDRYQIQMLYYAHALQQITQKKVKEAVIYSLALQKEVDVPVLLE